MSAVPAAGSSEGTVTVQLNVCGDVNINDGVRPWASSGALLWLVHKPLFPTLYYTVTVSKTKSTPGVAQKGQIGSTWFLRKDAQFLLPFPSEDNITVTPSITSIMFPRGRVTGGYIDFSLNIVGMHEITPSIHAIATTVSSVSALMGNLSCSGLKSSVSENRTGDISVMQKPGYLSLRIAGDIGSSLRNQMMSNVLYQDNFADTPISQPDGNPVVLYTGPPVNVRILSGSNGYTVSRSTDITWLYKKVMAITMDPNLGNTIPTPAIWISPYLVPPSTGIYQSSVVEWKSDISLPPLSPFCAPVIEIDVKDQGVGNNTGQLVLPPQTWISVTHFYARSKPEPQVDPYGVHCEIFPVSEESLECQIIPGQSFGPNLPNPNFLQRTLRFSSTLIPRNLPSTNVNNWGDCVWMGAMVSVGGISPYSFVPQDIPRPVMITEVRIGIPDYPVVSGSCKAVYWEGISPEQDVHLLVAGNLMFQGCPGYPIERYLKGALTTRYYDTSIREELLRTESRTSIVSYVYDSESKTTMTKDKKV